MHTDSRWERERLVFLKDSLSVSGASIIDIGGNTGYFSIELLESGADNVLYYEGNRDHSRFLSLAAAMLGVGERLLIKNEYYGFCGDPHGPVDIGLLLNVLHHVGDDYGGSRTSAAEALGAMAGNLNYMADKVDHLVLQIGYCWKGDTSQLLFPKGTKNEQIEFFTSTTEQHWDIARIGIAEKHGDSIRYAEPSIENLRRDDSMGEFLNRPIFILRSRK